MNGLIRNSLRFLFAWMVLAIINPLWFYPEPTGVVPFVGFLLALVGAVLLVHRSYSAKRLASFSVVIAPLIVSVGLSLSSLWRALVANGVPLPSSASNRGYTLLSLLSLVVAYGVAYWLVYRCGFAQLRTRMVG